MSTRNTRRAIALAVALFCVACDGGGGTAGTAVTSASPAVTAQTHTAVDTPTGSASAIATAAPLTAGCLGDDDRAHVVHLAAAGETLEALTLGAGRVGIVMAHELGEDLCQWKPYAESLAKRGYRVVTFSQGANLRAGVVAAAGELRREGAGRIMLVGASIGGTAVLAAAAVIKPPVAAVVDLSGPGELNGVDAASVVSRLTMPVLFSAGSLDEPYVTDTKAMYKKATRSTGRRLLIVPTGSHGVALVTGKTQTTIEAFLHAHASS